MLDVADGRAGLRSRVDRCSRSAATACGGHSKHVAQNAGAAEMDASLGDGMEEHGGGELDGLRVFERREVDFVLVGVGASDLHGVFPGTDERLFVLRIVTVARVYDLAGGKGAVMLFVKTDVEVAERFAGECGRLAAKAVGFDVAADRIGRSFSG